MRMRKLGQGQAVTFIVPAEIETKILEVTNKKEGEAISVEDVLIWSISETLMDLRKTLPLWATQGIRHDWQETIWQATKRKNTYEMTSKDAKHFLEDETQTLNDRYRPHSAPQPLLATSAAPPNTSIRAILDRCKKFNVLNFEETTLQEEQERELAPELEAERQTERPEALPSKKHQLCEELRMFVRTGKVQRGVFRPAFQAFAQTSAAADVNLAHFPSDILATDDFMRTVQLPTVRPCSDSYQRPVQWLLTDRTDPERPSIIIIISPYEAQELLSDIRGSSFVTLHIYAPRPHLSSRPLDDLRLYTTPRVPEGWVFPRRAMLLLNLFSGQLYFSSFAEYRDMCELLGLAWKPMSGDNGVKVEADGFIVRGVSLAAVGFSRSPVRFLKALLTKVRRDCKSIDKTHWGRVLAGEFLTEADFEDTEVMAVACD